MEDLLSRCEWPPLPPRYDRALKECVEFAIGRYDVTAVIATGTIIRGNPDASSDLDMYVVHKADYMQRVQRFFNGVPAEMFVNSFAQVHRHMDSALAEGRKPDSAHMIAHGFPVLDLADQVDELKARAIEILKLGPVVSDETLTRGRYRAATFLEDAVDVRERDPETADMILCDAVRTMIGHRVTEARVYPPRQKELLDILATIDEGSAAAAKRFYASRDPAERFDIAFELADRTIQTRGFFEWESAPIPTEP